MAQSAPDQGDVAPQDLQSVADAVMKALGLRHSQQLFRISLDLDFKSYTGTYRVEGQILPKE